MKRYVKAAIYDSSYHENYFLDNLHTMFQDAGYDLQVGNNLSLIATPISGKEYVPNLEITTFENDGVYTFGCKLSFPDVSAGEGSDSYHYDEAEVAIDQFNLAAKLVTSLASTEYDPSSFEK